MPITRHGIGSLMSQVVEDGNTLYLQGFTADDKTADIKTQTNQVLTTIDKALAAAGSDKSCLLSALIFVSDIALRPQMNDVWAGWIDQKNPPTRACAGVQLEGSTKVEIIVVAKKK